MLPKRFFEKVLDIVKKEGITKMAQNVNQSCLFVLILFLISLFNRLLYPFKVFKDIIFYIIKALIEQR